MRRIHAYSTQATGIAATSADNGRGHRWAETPSADTNGLRDARKIVRDTRGLMKGQSGDYVRGWRAALKQVENLLAMRLYARGPRASERKE